MDSAQLKEQEDISSPQTEKAKGISGSTIKIIAVAAMLIDHAAAAVLARYLVAGINEAAVMGNAMGWVEENALLYTVYSVMRAIGRLGFPIFCFLLVEGYQRTGDVKKYALRLGLFALLSEIPFDLAICGTPLHFGYQNVYFTLLLGLLALCAYGFFGKAETPEKALPAALRILLTVTGITAPAVYIAVDTGFFVNGGAGKAAVFGGIACVVTAGVFFWQMKKHGLLHAQTVCADLTALTFFMLLAELLQTDYSGMGVLTVSAMYLFRKRRAVSMSAGCVVLTVMSLSEIPAFLAVLPAALYNGKRGLKMKYFFYAFYPAHLLLLYVIAVLLGLGSVSLL